MLAVNRLIRSAGLALVVGLLLTSCSNAPGTSDTGTDTSAAGDCTYQESFAGIEVSGTAGQEPSIVVTEESQPATELGILDLCDGDGASIEESSIVTVDYVGAAESTGEVFESSFQYGQPATFGVSQVIAGWREGLLGMREGGTRMLVIPGELAYGEEPPGPGIGPNETLIFVVDLLAVQ